MFGSVNIICCLLSLLLPPYFIKMFPVSLRTANTVSIWRILNSANQLSLVSRFIFHRKKVETYIYVTIKLEYIPSMCECMLSCFTRVRLFATLWVIAHHSPLSVGFSRQEYWSGLPFPPPGDLLNPGIEPASPALQADSLPTEPPRGPNTFRNGA